MIAIIMFGVGFVSGMYVSTQIEKSIDKNITKNKRMWRKNKKDDQLNNYLYICRMKYNNIKRLLKQQIENGVRSFWTFDENIPEFTMIYKDYTNKLSIYTPQQLINYLDEKERAQ